MTRRAGLAILTAAALAAPVRAQTPAAAAIVGGPHVRPDGVEPRALVADAAARSATVRALLDRIERSDLVVYVRLAHFGSTRLDGRIGFVTAAAPPRGMPRILLIELACPRRTADQEATLAHELRHAAEIAEAPEVTGPAALADYYRSIGEQGEALGRGVAFETRAARETAMRVKREIEDDSRRSKVESRATFDLRP